MGVEKVFSLDKCPLSLDGEITRYVVLHGEPVTNVPASDAKRFCTYLPIVGVTITGDTVSLRPVVIFKGEGNLSAAEKHLYDNRVLVLFQKKGVTDEKVMVQALQKYCAGCCQATLDSAGEMVSRKLVGTRVPHGLTSYVQRLDCLWFMTFKVHYKKLYNTTIYGNQRKLAAAEKRVAVALLVAEAHENTMPDVAPTTFETFKAFGLIYNTPWGTSPQVVEMQCALARLQCLWVWISIPLLCVFLFLTEFSAKVAKDVKFEYTVRMFFGRLTEFSVIVAEKAFWHGRLSALHGMRMLFEFYVSSDSMICILSRDSVHGPKFPRYLSYIEAQWSGTLPVEVVGYLFSRLFTEECDLPWILVATTNPRLLACIPTALRQECDVVVRYLGPPESMKEDFELSLTARIKRADSVATVMWQHCLDDFAGGVPADFTCWQQWFPPGSKEHLDAAHISQEP